jgi:PAS domain S-box-containing protein
LTSEKRLLVVDDDPSNRELLRLALERHGYAIALAADGHEALARIAEARPDLILTDLQMPGLDGFALARQLKTDPATAGIVLIAMTAYAMKGDHARTAAAGFDGYLGKPLDPLALPATVAAFLRAGPGRAAGPNRRTGGPILVVDAHASTRRAVRAALEAAGHWVVEAADGAAALAEVALRVPALIVQDLALPDRDGFTLLAELRQRLTPHPVPIFCMTGFLTRVEESRASDAGFAQLLVKPIDPGQLLSLVETHLRARPAAGRRRRLLLADDDPLQRKLARVYLSHAGFEVFEAGNGVEALAKAEDHRPDVVVSDVLMPEMDGFELCLALRRTPLLVDVPVILLSNHYIEQADHQLAAKAGANQLLLRTPELSGVVAAVERALGGATGGELSPAPARTERSDITGEHEGRVSWQLERQVRKNALLTQRCSLQATQLAVLATTAQALTQHRPLEQILVEVLGICLDMAGIAKGALFLRAPAGGLGLHEQIGLHAGESQALAAFFAGPELPAEIAALTQATALPAQELPAELSTRLLAALAVRSAVLVPVLGPGELTGLFLFGGDIADVTAPDSMAFARVLGTQLAQAVGLVRAFDRLSVTEQRYRTLMDSAHDAVAVLREDGTIAEVNRRWLELHELPREQIVGRPIHEFYALDDGRPHGFGARASGLSGLSTPTRPVKLLRAKKPVYMEFSLTPLAIGSERLVLSIGRDVTERLHTQSQLMVADRMASVGMLAAGIAHEINNPLAAVLVNLELAASDAARAQAEGVELPGLQVELGNAREAAERVKNIVRDVRMFSRGQGEGDDDKIGVINVRSVLEAAVRMTWNEIRHRARLVRDYQDGAALLVTGSEARLGQVLVNLIVNAAQAIPEGRANDHEIRLSMRRQGADDDARVIVEVKDTGSGIPPEVERRLFTPFFTTKEGLGTGLGLSICQRIVTQMNGEISFETWPGRGTRFRVSLPAAPESARSVPAVAPVPAPRARRRGRILIIDDEVLLGQALRRALEHDHDTIATASAKDALNRLSNGETFDLILCDLIMPQMTGIELYGALRELSPELAGRMVFLTGGAFTAKGRAFLDETKNLVIEKPVDVQTIRSLVNQRIE